VYLTKQHIHQISKPIIGISLLVMGFMYSSCSKTEDKPPVVDNFPFIQYNYTTAYDFTEVKPDGTDTVFINGFSSNIATYLGNNVYRIVQLHHHFNDTLFWFKSTDEWAVLSTGGVKIDYLRSNAKVGDTYVALISRGGSKPDTLLTTIESLSETIKVPLGTFNCIKSKQSYSATSGFGGTYEIDYIDKKVGLIKMEFYSSNKLSGKYELHEKTY
jgi:hypothetical protein